jgi:hypothetical protein
MERAPTSTERDLKENRLTGGQEFSRGFWEAGMAGRQMERFRPEVAEFALLY